MRIDAHHHFWRLDRKDYGWLTKEAYPKLYRDFLPKDLEPHLRACGIDRTVLVQGAETVAETEFLLDIAHKTPFVGGVVGWVDFAAKDAPDVIARLAKDKALKSLRPMLQGLPEDDWILRPELAPALNSLKPNGLKFDVLIFPRHLPHIAKFFARHAELPMVIDHGAKPYIAKAEIEPWRSEMQAIARDFPLVCCKLSGLATEAAPDWKAQDLKPYVEALLEIFGPKRLMWGSDWPVLNLAGDYRSWFEIAQNLTRHLSSADRDDIFGGTAARFYGIS